MSCVSIIRSTNEKKQVLLFSFQTSVPLLGRFPNNPSWLMGTRGGAALHGRSPPRLRVHRTECGSARQDGFRSSGRVFHQAGRLCLPLPRQNPSRPPRAERIPHFVFMKRSRAIIFPPRRNILTSRKCCKVMKQLCRFGVKSRHAVGSRLRNVTFGK